MNILTFNKRHIPQLTWSQLTNNQIPGPNLNNNISEIQKILDDKHIINTNTENKLNYNKSDQTKLTNVKFPKHKNRKQLYSLKINRTVILLIAMDIY